MASVQSSGVNIDVQGLVTKLVAAERAKDDSRINRQETNLTVQLSGVSTLKGALSSFQSALGSLKTATTFSPRSISVSDQDALAATATASAAAGSYDVEIVSLAQAHQLASDPIVGGASANVGTGTLSISVGGNTFNVVIDENNNTVAEIRDAINAATNNTGVQATLVNGQAGTKLVLTATSTGAASAIRVSQSGGDGGLAQLEYDPNGTMNMTQLRGAQDAHVIIADTDIYSKTNTIEGAIDGLTLNLKQAQSAPGETVTLNIAHDTSAVQKSVETFVTAFNKMQETFVSLRAVDTAKKTTGPLFGDSLLRQVEDQIRSGVGNVVTGVTGDYTSLASIGITRQLDGKLALDSTKFNAAMSANSAGVANVFASENGVASRLSKYIDTQLATGASFDFRNTNLQKGLTDVSKQKEALEVRMAAVAARYMKQFTALDSMLSSMQQTSSYLSQQLASLPGAG